MKSHYFNVNAWQPTAGKIGLLCLVSPSVHCLNVASTPPNQDECMIWSASGDEKFQGSIGGSVIKMFATSKKYEYTVITDDEIKVVQFR